MFNVFVSQTKIISYLDKKSKKCRKFQTSKSKKHKYFEKFIISPKCYCEDFKLFIFGLKQKKY